MKRGAVLLGALWSVSVAGCGGSAHAHASTTVSGAQSTAAGISSTSTAITSRRASTAPPSRSRATTTAPPPLATAPPATPTAQSTTDQKSVATASNARLPATFTVHAGNRLSPPTVYAPAQIPVKLTIISGDARKHRVVVRTPAVHTLNVPANGSASVLLPGLKVGRYVLSVDGIARGALQIGVAPGP